MIYGTRLNTDCVILKCLQSKKSGYFCLKINNVPPPALKDNTPPSHVAPPTSLLTPKSAPLCLIPPGDVIWFRVCVCIICFTRYLEIGQNLSVATVSFHLGTHITYSNTHTHKHRPVRAHWWGLRNAETLFLLQQKLHNILIIILILCVSPSCSLTPRLTPECLATLFFSPPLLVLFMAFSL